MLSPRFLSQAPDPIVRMYADLESELMLDIIKRIGKLANYSNINPSRVIFQELSSFNKASASIIAKYANITTPELVALVNRSVIASLRTDEGIYKKMAAAGKLNKYLTLSESPILQTAQTNSVFIVAQRFQAHIAATSAAASAILGRGITQLITAKSNTFFDPQRFISKTIRSLGARGITTMADGGRQISIEAWVRQDIITALNKTAADVSMQRAAEVECDLVKTTAHYGARPEHAVWQGKIFSLSGTSKIYPPFKSSTGFGTITGLCGINCRHNYYPYFEGYSLEPGAADINASRNKEQYILEQQQRGYERKTREWKRINQMENSQGIDSEYSAMKVREYQGKLKDLTDSEPWLTRDYSREQIG